MIKLKNIYTGNVVYFRFFASKKFLNCFWYTVTTEATGFNIGSTKDYIPVSKTWKEIKNEKI